MIPTRCEYPTCKKKLTLTSIVCKCKKYYCTKHRHDVDHACTFDYRAEQKEQLNKFLSTPIVACKVDAI